MLKHRKKYLEQVPTLSRVAQNFVTLHQKCEQELRSLGKSRTELAQEWVVELRFANLKKKKRSLFYSGCCFLALYNVLCVQIMGLLNILSKFQYWP